MEQGITMSAWGVQCIHLPTKSPIYQTVVWRRSAKNTKRVNVRWRWPSQFTGSQVRKLLPRNASDASSDKNSRPFIAQMEGEWEVWDSIRNLQCGRWQPMRTAIADRQSLLPPAALPMPGNQNARLGRTKLPRLCKSVSSLTTCDSRTLGAWWDHGLNLRNTNSGCQ